MEGPMPGVLRRSSRKHNKLQINANAGVETPKLKAGDRSSFVEHRWHSPTRPVLCTPRDFSLSVYMSRSPVTGTTRFACGRRGNPASLRASGGSRRISSGHCQKRAEIVRRISRSHSRPSRDGCGVEGVFIMQREAYPRHRKLRAASQTGRRPVTQSSGDGPIPVRSSARMRIN